MTLPAPAPPRKKPFLYYVFHHPHQDAAIVAQSPSDSANHIALSVPAGVAGGEPITVAFEASDKPVTITAVVDNQIVARGIFPPHTTHAVIKALAPQDAARVLVIHAYAQGYSEAHAPVTIAARTIAFEPPIRLHDRR